MKELRAFPRLSLSCEIEYKLTNPVAENSPETIKSNTKDISSGGICLITYAPLQPGDIMELDFKLKGKEFTIKAKGKVIWTQEFEIGNQKGYDNGIEFVEISREARTEIEQYVQNMFSA